jgi:hypothetical protein
MAKQAAKQDHLAFIAELTASLEDVQSRSGVSAEERGRYRRWIEQAQSLRRLLEVGRKTPASPSREDDLPPALLKELSSRRRDRLEGQIVAVLAACNGSADLDQILIGLYRGFGVVEKRRVIQNKLWRLVRTGRICKAKNTRNVFSLEAPGQRERRGKRAR